MSVEISLENLIVFEKNGQSYRSHLEFYPPLLNLNKIVILFRLIKFLMKL